MNDARLGTKDAYDITLREDKHLHLHCPSCKLDLKPALQAVLDKHHMARWGNISQRWDVQLNVGNKVNTVECTIIISGV